MGGQIDIVPARKLHQSIFKLIYHTIMHERLSLISSLHCIDWQQDKERNNAQGCRNLFCDWGQALIGIEIMETWGGGGGVPTPSASSYRITATLLGCMVCGLHHTYSFGILLVNFGSGDVGSSVTSSTAAEVAPELISNRLLTLQPGCMCSLGKTTLLFYPC